MDPTIINKTKIRTIKVSIKHKVAFGIDRQTIHAFNQTTSGWKISNVPTGELHWR